MRVPVHSRLTTRRFGREKAMRMTRMRVAVLAGLGVSALLITASDALAQGCILLRQTSPMFGTTGTFTETRTFGFAVLSSSISSARSSIE